MLVGRAGAVNPWREKKIILLSKLWQSGDSYRSAKRGEAMTDWDDAYANGKYIAGAEEYPPRWAEKAEGLRDRLAADGRCRVDIAYGDDDREKYDLFLPDGVPSGLVVYIHGGYWRAFDKSSWSHLAAGSLERGYAVAMPSYSLCPDVRISQITRQIVVAVEAAARQVAGAVHLVGHSAGGHLVTRMVCDNIGWKNQTQSRIQRVVSISGVHDLRPLLHTEMNDDFGMDMAEAESESPVLCTKSVPAAVTTWVGANERPAFVEQSQLLANAWTGVDIVIDADKHHFDVIDGLEDADSPLTKVLLAG